MHVIESNNISAFDIDGTLLLYKDIRNNGPKKIEFTYGDEIIFLTPHRFHITFLKHCYNRGDTVILWSKNGVEWTKQVASKLNIENYVHYCMSKPTRHVDDKTDIPSIAGDRIYIPEEEQ